MSPLIHFIKFSTRTLIGRVTLVYFLPSARRARSRSLHGLYEHNVRGTSLFIPFKPVKCFCSHDAVDLTDQSDHFNHVVRQTTFTDVLAVWQKRSELRASSKLLELANSSKVLTARARESKELQSSGSHGSRRTCADWTEKEAELETQLCTMMFVNEPITTKC